MYERIVNKKSGPSWMAAKMYKLILCSKFIFFQNLLSKLFKVSKICLIHLGGVDMILIVLEEVVTDSMFHS